MLKALVLPEHAEIRIVIVKMLVWTGQRQLPKRRLADQDLLTIFHALIAVVFQSEQFSVGRCRGYGAQPFKTRDQVEPLARSQRSHCWPVVVPKVREQIGVICVESAAHPINLVDDGWSCHACKN